MQGVIVDRDKPGLYICPCGNPAGCNYDGMHIVMGAHPQGPNPVTVVQIVVEMS